MVLAEGPSDPNLHADFPLYLGSPGSIAKRDEHSSWSRLQNDFSQAGYWKIETKKKIDKKIRKKSGKEVDSDNNINLMPTLEKVE